VPAGPALVGECPRCDSCLRGGGDLLKDCTCGPGDVLGPDRTGGESPIQALGETVLSPSEAERIARERGVEEIPAQDPARRLPAPVLSIAAAQARIRAARQMLRQQSQHGVVGAQDPQHVGQQLLAPCARERRVAVDPGGVRKASSLSPAVGRTRAWPGV
jgi:hypothetical protein